MSYSLFSEMTCVFLLCGWLGWSVAWAHVRAYRRVIWEANCHSNHCDLLLIFPDLPPSLVHISCCAFLLSSHPRPSHSNLHLDIPNWCCIFSFLPSSFFLSRVRKEHPWQFYIPNPLHFTYTFSPPRVAHPLQNFPGHLYIPSSLYHLSFTVRSPRAIPTRYQF